MTFLEKLMICLLALVAFGQLASWFNAREIKRSLDLSARALALNLAAHDADIRAQLAEIYHKVDGRLDLALDKVTRLETALARERGIEPLLPNPLSINAVIPVEE